MGVTNAEDLRDRNPKNAICEYENRSGITHGFHSSLVISPLVPPNILP